MKVALHYDPTSVRSQDLASAMALGVRCTADEPVMVQGFDPLPNARVGFAYGWRRPEMFDAYVERGGTFVYADLGWWNRKPTGMPREGHHKLVVGAREPLAYFQNGHDATRAQSLGVTVRPWRTEGSFILLAGMSAKSAGTRGFEPYEWEKTAIERIRQHTDRPIVFRPKPSWADARPIEGCGFSPSNVSVERALRDCWAIVTLHSNVAVDALCAGVPCVTEEGVASVLSGTYETLDDPPLPEGREQLMADITWQQWSLAEIRAGLPWRHFRTQGLLT